MLGGILISPPSCITTQRTGVHCQDGVLRNWKAEEARRTSSHLECYHGTLSFTVVQCVGLSDVCKVCVPRSHGDALRTRWRLQQALQTLLLYEMGQWKSNFPSKRSWSEWTRKNLRQWFSAWHGENGELAEGSSFDIIITLKRSFSKYTAVLSASSRCVISKTRVPTVVKYNPLGCGNWSDIKNHLVKANMFCLW